MEPVLPNEPQWIAGDEGGVLTRTLKLAHLAQDAAVPRRRGGRGH